MSSVERAAGLLGAGEQPAAKPGAHDSGGGPAGPDLIERAAAALLQRRPAPGAVTPAEKPKVSSKPARGADDAARQFKVDRERLRAQGFITPDIGRTATSESFRRIKRQILANIASPRPDAPPANIVMVTSSMEGEGKSFCAINLALSLALEVDRTVLLVDGDVAKAAIPRAFGLRPDKGLMEVLRDRQIRLTDVIWKTDIGRLSLLPVGSADGNSTELLASEAMRSLLQELVGPYHDRIVIFDSPPLLAASEAGVLAAQAGQIVVVVEAGRTSEAALQDALGRVDAARVTGLILNKVEGSRLDYGYYGYG